MEVHHRNATLEFWVTSKDFAPVFILKTHWKYFHPNPKNLRLHRVFSKKFMSNINKFFLYLPQIMERNNNHKKNHKNRNYGSKI